MPFVLLSDHWEISLKKSFLITYASIFSVSKGFSKEAISALLNEWIEPFSLPPLG